MALNYEAIQAAVEEGFETFHVKSTWGCTLFVKTRFSFWMEDDVHPNQNGTYVVP